MKKEDIKQRKIDEKKREAENDGAGSPDGLDRPANQAKLEDDKIKQEIKMEAMDVSIGLFQGNKKRFEYENMEYDDERKWTYLEHHGVVFPDPYKPRGLHILYGG